MKRTQLKPKVKIIDYSIQLGEAIIPRITPKSASKKPVTPQKRPKVAKTLKRMIYGVKVWSLKVADNYYSKWIRESKDYTCEMCGYYEAPPTPRIQCSHYIGRAHKATRFYPPNTDVLCATCHHKMEDLKQYDYRDWKIKQMGEKAHNKLKAKQLTSLGEKDAIYNCMKLLGKIK